MSARAGAAAVALALALAPAAARANGAFPSSGQIVVDPGDPARIALRTTYGLVATEDAGASWRWTCETALGYGGEFHPQLGVAPDGTVFAGLLDGMVRGSIGGCAWERVASLQGRMVTDVSVDASGRALASVFPPGAGARGELWTSDDQAATWQRLGAQLPIKFFPLTLDAAGSDPDRLYVSGLLDGDTLLGALARSDDGGDTWSLSVVTDSDAQKAPYIGAIDPFDPDVVWIRLDAAPGQLLVTRDGGDSFETVLLLDGFLRAFALSPDGAEVIAGGEVDGLARSDAADVDFQPLSTVAAKCAQWRDDAIDVCGTAPLDGFSMGRSTDGGRTFQPFFEQRCLIGPHPCGVDTPVGACNSEWPAVREQLQATGCGEGGGGATTSGASSSGAGPGGGEPGTTSGGGGSAATTPITAAGPGATGPGGLVTVGTGRDGEGGSGERLAGGGCDCRAGASDGIQASGVAGAALALAGALTRRRRRSRGVCRRGHP